MKINYKGFTVIQSSFNYHVSVYKNDILVFHAQCDIALDYESLMMIVDYFVLNLPCSFRGVYV